MAPPETDKERKGQQGNAKMLCKTLHPPPDFANLVGARTEAALLSCCVCMTLWVLPVSMGDG